MLSERRRTPRARIRGARVRYEAAFGEPMTGRVLDLSRGGLFIETDRPMAVKKRISVEIQVPGELAPWLALGRVVWIRPATAADRAPPGMGVAFIDVDDAVLAAIERVLGRESAAGPASGGPSREPTVLGVGPVVPATVPPSPIVSVTPAREKTVRGLGLGPPPEPAPPQEPCRDLAPTVAPEGGLVLRHSEFDESNSAATPRGEVLDSPGGSAPFAPEIGSRRFPSTPPSIDRNLCVEVLEPAEDEASVAIDLVAKQPAPTAQLAPAPEQPLPPELAPRRGRAGLVVVLILACSAAAGFAFRDRLRPWAAPYLARTGWAAPASPQDIGAAPTAGAAMSASPREVEPTAAGRVQAPLAPGAGAAAPRPAESPAASSASLPPKTAGGSPPAPAPKSPPRHPASPATRPVPPAPTAETPDNPDNPY